MLKGKEKLLIAVMLIFTAIAAFVVGRVTSPEPIVQQVENNTDESDVQELRSGGYTFINPLLECDNYKPSRLNSVVMMRNDVQNYIQKIQEEKKATFVSVYFRSLMFGPWMGLNEKENFSPASLLKVPIMIAALKKAETEPAFLRKQIAYTRHLDNNAVPNITDPNLVKLGKTYTVENLIERMIEYSDNEAKELLLQQLDANFIMKVIADIGVNVTGNMAQDFVSVKDYSGFFRLLYNATYLNRDMSEKALSILSKTSFDRGIVAGVPKGTVVSHKFGERAYTDSNIKQLHECGIVYLEGNPYLLCIMTRGTDFAQLSSVLAEISAIVYKNIQIRN